MNTNTRYMFIEIGGAVTRAAIIDKDHRSINIANVWSFSMPLLEDAHAHNNQLSDTAIKKNTTLLEALTIIGQNYRVTETKAFLGGDLKKTQNINAAIPIWSNTGCTVQIIPDSIDGILSFETACLIAQHARNKAIVIDSGAGHGKIATLVDNAVALQEGVIGLSGAIKAFREKTNHQSSDISRINPIGKENFYKLVECLQQQITISPWLSQKTNKQDVTVLCLGYIFNIAANFVHKNPFSLNDLIAAIENHALYDNMMMT